MLDCPRCGSLNTIKAGVHRKPRKDGTIYIRQRFKCLKCGRRFSQNTSKRARILILVPRPMLANLFFELKTFLQASPTVRSRKGEVTIREIS